MIYSEYPYLGVCNENLQFHNCENILLSAGYTECVFQSLFLQPLAPPAAKVAIVTRKHSVDSQIQGLPELHEEQVQERMSLANICCLKMKLS